jgi:hypothetical protein
MEKKWYSDFDNKVLIFLEGLDCIQDYWDLELYTCSVSQRTQCFKYWTCFYLQVKGWETLVLLGPLERSNFSDWDWTACVISLHAITSVDEQTQLHRMLISAFFFCHWTHRNGILAFFRWIFEVLTQLNHFTSRGRHAIFWHINHMITFD